jgi:hypothetical protein
MPADAELASHASETEVCVTDEARRLGGAVGPVLLRGGGVVDVQAAVAAVTDVIGERFCALSAASTPSVYV